MFNIFAIPWYLLTWPEIRVPRSDSLPSPYFRIFLTKGTLGVQLIIRAITLE